MEFNTFSSVFFLFLLAAANSVPASSSISDGVFEFGNSFTGRTLLQALTPCPVSFEFLNYTIITSQCKGPLYPPEQCCSAFKDFACPYADQIDDLTTDCATTMFSYIVLYGNYPPGLFASECTEGKDGLACPALPPSASQNNNGGQSHSPSVLPLMASTAFLWLIKLL